MDLLPRIYLRLAHWVQRRLLTLVAQGHPRQVVVHPTHHPVLRLHLLRQFRPLAERRVLEVHLSEEPLLPGLSRVDDWVGKYPFGFD
jgi:hypothetical protein